MARILVIDDEESLRYTFRVFLTEEGHEVETVEEVDAGLAYLHRVEPSLILVDLVLGRRTGLDFLREAKNLGVPCPIVMITGEPSVESVTEALRLGAYDYLVKPVRKEQLLGVTRRSLEHGRLLREREEYRANLEAVFRSVNDGIVTVDRERRIIQHNEAFRELCHLSERVELRSRALDETLTERCGPLGALLDEVFEHEGSALREFSCQAKSGDRRMIICTADVLRDHRGRASGAVLVLKDVSRLHRLERELQVRHGFQNMIGRSEVMQRVFELIEQLGKYDTTVLITGESGTGKERVAEAIHRCGVRAARPFVKVNCSALAEGILESELFGHVKGAFTGAVDSRIGRFMAAEGGTIFLDEIGDISPRIQSKLLRVLQEKEVERVGSVTTVKVDVRVVAATNKNLVDLVAKRLFREDLYYRLKVVEVAVPPLRARLTDLPLLVDTILNRLHTKYGKKIRGMDPEVLALFMRYPWPGNIRELENTLEHAFIVCRGPAILPEHVPAEVRSESGFEARPRFERLPVARESEIAGVLREALRLAGGNKAKAARAMGISRRTIYRMLERFGVEEVSPVPRTNEEVSR
ncbi:MAG: hypothetical protein A2284_14060 [Deltaproteobacteria bacterium RIFOXYA12_FULL_61_11]|nr:MAG: hypothetical protein A2284_14060 [Deltaproteobacteria bacterium RIFOXYA12_FULL_61_11]